MKFAEREHENEPMQTPSDLHGGRERHRPAAVMDGSRHLPTRCQNPRSLQPGPSDPEVLDQCLQPLRRKDTGPSLLPCGATMSSLPAGWTREGKYFLEHVGAKWRISRSFVKGIPSFTLWKKIPKTKDTASHYLLYGNYNTVAEAEAVRAAPPPHRLNKSNRSNTK